MLALSNDTVLTLPDYHTPQRGTCLVYICWIGAVPAFWYQSSDSSTRDEDSDGTWSPKHQKERLQGYPSTATMLNLTARLYLSPDPQKRGYKDTEALLNTQKRG